MLRSLLSLLILCPVMCPGHTINVPLVEGDATEVLQAAIDECAERRGERVTIRLERGTYDISRNAATKKVYHISNTASEAENPDATKHIALLFKDLENVTFDGNGSTLLTHGELTTFVIDNCTNIRLTDFTLRSADPTVPEFEVAAVDSTSFRAAITEPTLYYINEGEFRFVGEGWTLPDDGRLAGAQFIAQVFYPELNVTRRIANPIRGYIRADSVAPGVVDFHFERTPKVAAGEIYQLRHSVRNEACGHITHSKDVSLDNIRFNFMGNFGIVSQMSENITMESLTCAPDVASQRTCAGFADFLQFSSCKGLIAIRNCAFEGSHDDPINIHGTHLQVVSALGKEVEVRYMHPQTFGFAPVAAGDSIEFVNKSTLLCEYSTEVVKINPKDKYSFIIEVADNLPLSMEADSMVVENITMTPEVLICGNRFARTPTRAILLTTRRKSVICDNLFFRIPMASILVSDDARNWYESGPVHDLSIVNNIFYECSAPAILIKPEVERLVGAVHKNIIIENNTFINQPEPAIEYSGAEGVVIKDNFLN